MNKNYEFFTVLGTMDNKYVSTFTGQIFPIDCSYDGLPLGYFSLFKKYNHDKYKIIHYVTR